MQSWPLTVAKTLQDMSGVLIVSGNFCWEKWKKCLRACHILDFTVMTITEVRENNHHNNNDTKKDNINNCQYQLKADYEPGIVLGTY